MFNKLTYFWLRIIWYNHGNGLVKKKKATIDWWKNMLYLEILEGNIVEITKGNVKGR